MPLLRPRCSAKNARIVDAHPEGDISKARIEEITIALRKLGMAEDIEMRNRG